MLFKKIYIPEVETSRFVPQWKTSGSLVPVFYSFVVFVSCAFLLLVGLGRESRSRYALDASMLVLFWSDFDFYLFFYLKILSRNFVGFWFWLVSGSREFPVLQWMMNVYG